MKKQVTATGIEHGLIESLPNAEANTDYKQVSEKHRKELLDRRKSDLELVKVYYENRESENGRLECWYSDHPTVPMYNFRFLHGHRYTVPRGLKRKVNAMGTRMHSDIVSLDGKKIDMPGKINRTHILVEDPDL